MSTVLTDLAGLLGGATVTAILIYCRDEHWQKLTHRAPRGKP